MSCTGADCLKSSSRVWFDNLVKLWQDMVFSCAMAIPLPSANMLQEPTPQPQPQPQPWNERAGNAQEPKPLSVDRIRRKKFIDIRCNVLISEN